MITLSFVLRIIHISDDTVISTYYRCSVVTSHYVDDPNKYLKTFETTNQRRTASASE